jgi:hypothetical protein
MCAACPGHLILPGLITLIFGETYKGKQYVKKFKMFENRVLRKIFGPKRD